MQRRVPVAVLVGRVSPKPKKQAQGGGIVAGTGPVQWRGLPSIYIKAWMSLEEGLGPDQPTCRQVTTEATLSALAAGIGGHGTLGLKGKKASVRTPALASSSPSVADTPSVPPWGSRFLSLARDEACPNAHPLPDDRLEKILRGAGVTDLIF